MRLFLAINKTSPLHTVIIKLVFICLLILVITPNVTLAQSCPVSGQSADPLSVEQIVQCYTCAASPQTVPVLTGPVAVTATFSGGFRSYCGTGYVTVGDGPTGCSQFTPKIEVSFSAPVSQVTMGGFDYNPNHIITVADDQGHSVTSAGGASATFPGPGIRKVTVSVESADGGWLLQVGGVSFIPDEATPAAGPIHLNTESGPSSSTIFLYGDSLRWFNPNFEPYQVFFDDLLVAQKPAFNCTAPPSVDFDIPCGTPPGVYNVVCKIGNVASPPVQFTVTGAGPNCPCIPATGNITLSSNSGIAGDEVTLSGTGWISGTSGQYQILFDGVPLIGAIQPVQACTDQPNITFNIPCTATTGTHSISCQLGSLVSTPITFTVVPSLATVCQSPTVQIQPFKLIPKGSSLFIQVTVNPSPSKIPITLTLSRNDKKGKEIPSGKAIFKSNQSQQLEITESQVVEISGIDASSNENNIELKAIIKNGSSDIILAEQPFSILWVEISIRVGDSPNKNENKFSNDNSAKQAVTRNNNSDDLGLQFTDGSSDPKNHLWATVVEFVGKVMPSDYTGQIVLQRILVEKLTYADKRLLPQLTETNKPDTSFPKALDTDPQSGGSKGLIYDIDSPGVAIQPSPNNSFGTILRQRRNFIEFATTPDLLTEKGGFVRVSDLFDWFNRISVIKLRESKNEFNNEIERTVPEDNKAGKGKTNTTSDLK